MKMILNFFLSLRTAIWLLLALIVMLFFGAFVMPAREEFQSINSMALFGWLKESPLAATWWLWGAISVLSVLTANTLLCSIESVIKKRSGRQWLLVLSPQVIHIGFLFILLGHLIDAYSGMKGSLIAREETAYALPNGVVMKVGEMSVDIGPQGYPTGWRADIEFFSSGGQNIGRDYLAPNRPSFFKGLGIYLKTIRPYPVKAAVIEINREPGAFWALIGCILFTAGTVSLAAFKIKKEGQRT